MTVREIPHDLGISPWGKGPAKSGEDRRWLLSSPLSAESYLNLKLTPAVVTAFIRVTPLDPTLHLHLSPGQVKPDSMAEPSSRSHLSYISFQLHLPQGLHAWEEKFYQDSVWQAHRKGCSQRWPLEGSLESCNEQCGPQGTLISCAGDKARTRDPWS